MHVDSRFGNLRKISKLNPSARHRDQPDDVRFPPKAAVRVRPIADISQMADAGAMTLQPLWKGSELLHKLLTDYLGGRIDTPVFCSNFEQAFNFDVDRNALTPIESDAFQRLFDEVVYYSPFAEERAAISNYRSEAQIKKAAQRAATMLR